ncbi:sensor histidine kinase [Azohydromonas aeria]|uniref:sensor histidine kinase n=1 Tax=Azohydromonas aeria TaxID=2590212 RepID=UPI0012F7E9C2|nr:ATP-binding protein [Azohydromonas aeria]
MRRRIRSAPAFTAEDLRRAAEAARREERLRLAQDLHDDLGARLLALLVHADDARSAEALRLALQDLKLLTRGLAAGCHRLLHAEAEWRAELHRRLADAGCALAWRFEADADLDLGVAQWSALTRVLRELTSNAIAHARATRVDIEWRCAGRRLELTVRDDGPGGDPQQWAHGLGLSGVRRRVRDLGGEVTWQPCAPRGIECRVVVPQLQDAAARKAPLAGARSTCSAYSSSASQASDTRCTPCTAVVASSRSGCPGGTRKLKR